MNYRIGIDIGGTVIKAGAYAAVSGEILRQETAPTGDGKREAGRPAWLANVRRLVSDMESDLGVAEHVGIAAPGLANASETAIAFMPGRLAGLEGLNWKDALGRAEEVRVLNDAQAALTGEAWQGAAKGMRDVVMLTLGTGVGGAVMSGGQLLRGSIGRAGHVGHMTVDFEGAPDICGTPGSLEDAIGNATILARSGGSFKTTHALVAAFADGDDDAGEIWMRSLRALGAAIVSLVNVLDPESVIIGGGIARAGDHLFEPLRGIIEEREWKPAGHRVRILPAKLGEWAGSFGAASP